MEPQPRKHVYYMYLQRNKYDVITNKSLYVTNEDVDNVLLKERQQLL